MPSESNVEPIAFTPGDLVRARGREWVAVPSHSADVLALRPLSGSEKDTVLLDPSLEIAPVEPARFDLPEDANPIVQAKAALLADALRLTLRRGAGPFRCAAQISFEPRIYQLVPLLMALRLRVPRILIADDVGIGKTIEAGLILRELMDRGETDAFAVLCPPHLVEQWTTELRSRFSIDPVAVTSGTAARLERGLPVAQSLFEAYPHTVVSLDYIKAERRREAFAQACPDFVIVDEAHSCVGTHRGKQQRFALLRRLASDPERRMIMLTATPHSGDAEAFSRLLSLIDNEFASPEFDDVRYRQRLARHFVQRRRIDVTSGDWGESQAFPKHETTEVSYTLSPLYLQFQESVLDYCLGIVGQIGSDRHERHLAYWGTLALMRCVGSSPRAALRALRNRMATEVGRVESQIYDEDGDNEDAVDVEPSVAFEVDSSLRELIESAESLIRAPDPKVEELVRILGPLLKEGANPVVFCRFIATAEHVRDALREHYPRLRIESVTGVLTPGERRARVEAMADGGDDEVQRILVATDCLSEGINLQRLFDTVIHYDLSWNPTRHQQREGRVDRFGQPAKLVRSVMMYSSDSAIDGAVLKVILKKAAAIREATGVTVPLPEERGPVTEALMAAVMLLRGEGKQMVLDLRLADGSRQMDVRWRDALENEQRSRARFAQNAMKPQEVAPEWKRSGCLLGSPEAALGFVERAMAVYGVPLESAGSDLKAHLHALDRPLRERLGQYGLSGSIRLARSEPAQAGTSLLSRTHPLTTAVAESIVEGALDPVAMSGLEMGRLGAWPTRAVSKMTRVLLLRLRFKLAVHSRKERLLLAEEAALIAVEGSGIVSSGEAVRSLLDAPATGDLAHIARQRIIGQALEALPDLLRDTVHAFVRERAKALADDHAKLRVAAGSVPRVSVDGMQPPDAIGLFVLLPSGD